MPDDILTAKRREGTRETVVLELSQEFGDRIGKKSIYTQTGRKCPYDEEKTPLNDRCWKSCR